MLTNEKTQPLRHHALEIFRAGVDAVRPEMALLRHCVRQGEYLTLGDDTWDLRQSEAQ